MRGAATAASLGVPEAFNAAEHFVDRHVRDGGGDRIAIECLDERVTYAQLLDGVNRVARALVDAGVRPGERVALILHDGPAFAYCFMGAIKMGAVPVPINTQWKRADHEFVLRDSRARVLVVSEALWPMAATIDRAALPALAHVVVAGAKPDGVDASLEALMAEASPDVDAYPTTRDDMAFWLYSSGSTGRPKGCVHLQHDMVVCAELFAKGVLGIKPADRCFSVAKLFFAYGLGNALYFPFAVGATAILWPGAPTPPNVYATIERHHPTLLYSVPTGYAMMLARPPAPGARDFDLSSVRLAVSAGEALPPALYQRFLDRFGVRVIDGIGSTEVLHMFISNRPDAIRPGSSGQLVDGYEARLLDDERRPVSTGTIGNLWIKGDSVCAGYWNQHEKTKQTIEGDWILTGDRYSQDADGYFWYAGRTDDMLKVGGLWVSPVEVENVLVEHPAVLECAVVAREDRDALVKPAACVVLQAGVDGTPELALELQQFVRDRLAEYKRPRWVEFLPELPKTATGKIQRFKLRASW